MFLLKLFYVFLFYTQVISQECVIYNFENDLDLFNNDRAVCAASEEWNFGFYNTTDFQPPNNQSTTFIYPNTAMSCIASNTFTIDTQGRIEINAHINSVSLADQILVLIQGLDDDVDVVIGQVIITSMDGNFVSTDGVTAYEITWLAQGSYEGYVSIMGLADENSVVLIDSLRYVPPNLSEDDCQIYDEETESTEVETEGTTEGTTTTIDLETTTETVTVETTTDAGNSETETEGTTDITTEGTTEITTEETTETTTEGEETTEDTDSSTTGDIETTTLPSTDSVTAETTVDGAEVTTEGPIIIYIQSPFWNAVTITSLAMICLILLAIICWLFYECGRRRSAKKEEQVLEDLDNLPKTIVVPRVTRVYTDNPYTSFKGDYP